MSLLSLNVEILTPKVIILQVGPLGGYVVMRSELLLMGLVPLRKRIPRALLPFPPWTRPEDDHLWTRQWVLTRHQICWHLDLRLLDFRTMEIKYLLFLRHSVFGILLQQSRWTKTYIFFFFLLMLAKKELLTWWVRA